MKKCSKYPCHKNVENMDCVFCYCPAYPCEIEGVMKNTKTGYNECSDCTVVHDKKHINNLLNYFFSLYDIYCDESKLDLAVKVDFQLYMKDYIRLVVWLDKNL